MTSKKKKQTVDQLKIHKFWSTQPVPGLDEQSNDHAPIEQKTLEDVHKDAYNLPKGYSWDSCDITDPATVDEIYKLLCENYVEDDDNVFRFDYSRNFLRWALMPPEYKKVWHVGVRANNKLVGFITGIPAHMRVYDADMQMVEINFLCVHKTLRSKRLAPVLIKEITRRINLEDIWQAVYTAGVVLPKPVAQNRYYHRSLNPKKLIDIGFSRLQVNMNLNRTIKLFRVPKITTTPGLRQLEAKDVPSACELLNKYLSNFALAQQFTEDEFAHWFIPRQGVVNAYVVTTEAGKVTDLCSFYTLPSTIIGHNNYNTLKAAYSFYNVAGSVSWEVLMADALVLAKNDDFDVFNALNVMDNDSFLKPLKFRIGDGNLHYYLYNWRCPQMDPNQVGLVLL